MKMPRRAYRLRFGEHANKTFEEVEKAPGGLIYLDFLLGKLEWEKKTDTILYRKLVAFMSDYDRQNRLAAIYERINKIMEEEDGY